MLSGFITEEEAGTESSAGSDPATGWLAFLEALVAERRATVAVTALGRRLWVAAERLAQLLEVLPDVTQMAAIAPVRAGSRGAISSRSDALRELIRGRLETLGPVTAEEAPGFGILKTGKEAFYNQAEMGLAEAYDYASRVMVENMMARDAEEGIGAFIERRSPEWTGS